jgi:hypothetical protein
MATYPAQIAPPYPVFYDLNGKPLQNGKLYFGAPGANPETSPQAVYWDSALTQPAGQPVRTINGMPIRGASPGTLYSDKDYSMSIRDSSGQLVLNLQNIARGIGYNYSGRTAVFATGIAATDLAAIRGAIATLPINGVLDFFGDFVIDQEIVVKPQILLRPGNGGTITQIVAGKGCFILKDDNYAGSGAGSVQPAGTVWTGTTALHASGRTLDAYPGRFAIDGLEMFGAWTSGSEALGTQTWGNISAAVYIEANAPFSRIENVDIQNFFAQVMLRGAYHATVSGNFYGGVHGVMLYAECHDAKLETILCNGNLRTGLSCNYGNPSGKTITLQSIQCDGGAFQYNDAGIWLESTQGFSGVGTLYFEGNRIRDMQIGVADGGAYRRTASFTRIQGIGTSSPVATASVSPLVARPQGANIEVAHSVDVYLRGAGFYAGTPATTEHIIVDGYCDRTFIEPAFLTSVNPYLFTSPDRVVTERAGRRNYAAESLSGLTYGAHGSSAPNGRGPYLSSAGTPSGRPAIIIEALTDATDLILKAKAGQGQVRIIDSSWSELFSFDFINKRLNCYVPIVTKVYTVATLPTPSGTIPPGSRAMVSDSNSSTFNAIVASGAPNITVPVFVDGTGNWRIG